jgi:polyhydroxyalkanoate synthesis regulator phasin
MAAKKRAARRSGLVQQAVKAGRRAFRQAESRVPADLRKQLERTINDGQKAVHTAIKELEAQVKRTARQADVDKALKRLESLSKQVQELARGVASRGAPTRRRAPSARKPAKARSARRSSTTKTATRGPAARKAKTGAAAPTRRPARRASTRSRSSRPAARIVPPAPVPGPVPESVDSGSPTA